MPFNRIRSTLRLGVIAAALLSSGATPGAAQEVPVVMVTSQERLHALFSQLSPNRHVQVVTPGLFVEDGEFLGLGTSVVELSQGGAPVSVELDEIRAVSLRSGHSIQGMLWGLGAGLLVGSVSGLMVGSFNCQTPAGCNSAEKEGAVRWGSVFGVIGGAAGFMIGRHNVYWRPVFP
jgi:hypothetical protein